MQEICYEVIRYGSGWGVVLGQRDSGNFPTQSQAFDMAVKLARTLRLIGLPVVVRLKYPDLEEVPKSRQGAS
jgi:hypothetical protein